MLYRPLGLHTSDTDTTAASMAYDSERFEELDEDGMAHPLEPIDVDSQMDVD